MLERIGWVEIYSSTVSAGFTLNASLDRSYLDFCSLGNRTLEQLMNPKSNLLHIEKCQLSDFELNGQNFFDMVLFYRIQDISYDFVGDGKLVHG